MGPNRVLVLAAIVFAICNSSVQDTSFLIDRIRIKNEKGIFQHTVVIQGNGIDTELKMHPNSYLAPVLIINNGFVLGNPRNDAVTAFTDTADALVVIRGSQECVRRSREYDGIEEYSKLTDAECQKLTQTIVKSWDEFKESGAVNNYNTHKAIYVIKTRETNGLGVCLGSIRISGHWVDDTSAMSCANVKSAKVLFVPEGVLVWDRKFLYTNTLRQLTTIQDKTCQTKIFGTYEKVTSADLEPKMTFREEKVLSYACDTFRDIVEHYKKHPPADINIKHLDYFIEKDVKYQQFQIEGNGVVEVVSIPDMAVQNLQLLYIPGGFVLGDWKEYFAFVYSDTFNTLVVITLDVCEQSTYMEGKMYKKVPIERRPQIEKMLSVWENTGKKEAEKGYTVHLHSWPEETEKCIQDILIEGRGMESRFTAPCKSGNYLQTIFTDTGVMVGDYIRNPKSIIADANGEIVVVEYSKCKRHDYRGSSPRIDDLSDWECQRVKRKMEKARNRHLKGYFVALEKRNKEIRIIRENYQEGPEICMQNIKLSGNGINEVITAACMIADKLDVLFLQEGFLLGDYRYDKICVLALSPGSLAVITKEGEVCKNRNYIDFENPFEKPINMEDCDMIKQYVDVAWESKQNNRYWTSTQKSSSADNEKNKIFIEIVKTVKRKVKITVVKIKGNGINDKIFFNTQDDTTTVFIKGGFLLGNLDRNSKYIYSNETSTLYVVQKDKYVWKCRKLTYTDGMKSDYPMKDDLCNKMQTEAKDRLNKMLKNKANVAKILTGINILKTITTNEDECKGFLTVQGDGMNEMEGVDCDSLKITDVLFTLKGVVVGDPSKTSVTFFSDKAKSLVLIKNGKCTTTTYIPWVATGNQYSYTVKEYIMHIDLLNETDCTEVKQVMSGYLNKNKNKTNTVDD